MWKKLVAVVIGIAVGYWFIDDFNPGATFYGTRLGIHQTKYELGISRMFFKMIAWCPASTVLLEAGHQAIDFKCILVISNSVKGKNVLLTGASTGIGEQMAYHYARLGANVVITARREKRLQEVVAKCKELGTENQKFDYVVADMSKLNTTEKVVKATVAKLGSLDFLVLNHIILLDLGMWEGTPQNLSLIDKVLRVNFQSYVYLTSHSLPHLEKSSGSIIVVSSLAGKFGQPFVSIYSASKFALDGFYGGLRQELLLKDTDISITLCILGFIGTDNAVNQLLAYGQDYLVSSLKAASPSDTAYAMIRDGALRVREMYYPRTVQVVIKFRDWFPSSIEYLIRSFYTRVS